MASLFTGGADEPSVAAIGKNGEVVAYMRSVGSIIGGCIAGILGLTGFSGAAFYVVVSLGVSLALLFKTHAQPHKYFADPVASVLFAGVFERNMLLSYLLFWTFFYAFR